MSYEPINWKDRIVEKPRTYYIQNNPDGTITLIPAPGTVVQEGTPVNAANLNHMEQAIVTHLPEKATETKLGHVKAKTKADGTLIIPINIPDGNMYNAVLMTKDVTKLIATSDNYGGNIYAIAVDDTYVYVGGHTTKKVRKLNKSDLSQVAESADYGGSIYAIAADDTYVYVGGETTRTVKKLNKSDLSPVAESVSYGGDIRAIAVDDTYVYVGGITTRTVKKLGGTQIKELIKVV